MAFYKAKVKCYVDNAIREEGDVFEYEGPENGNLELAGKGAPVQSEATEDEAKPQKGFARKAAKAATAD